MTVQPSTAPRHHPGTATASDGYARQHLAAIADTLTAHGIPSRLERLGAITTLTIDRPGTGPDPATISIDPDPHGGPGLYLDCTCIWTPGPGTTPQATAAAILTILSAIGPGPSHEPPGT
jgi:hypothetical protein